MANTPLYPLDLPFDPIDFSELKLIMDVMQRNNEKETVQWMMSREIDLGLKDG